MKRLAALLVLILMLGSFACAESTPALFTASASAPFTAEADSAVITLNITASSEALSDAETMAAASVQGLTEALLNAGAAQEAISVVRSDAQANWQYHYNKLQEPELVLIGRTVEYQMIVTVEDVAQLNALVDAAVNSGLYTTYEVEQHSSQWQSSYLAALETAAKQASDKAMALAKACGTTQTKVVSVVELPGEFVGLSGVAQVEVTLGAAN